LTRESQLVNSYDYSWIPFYFCAILELSDDLSFVRPRPQRLRGNTASHTYSKSLSVEPGKRAVCQLIPRVRCTGFDSGHRGTGEARMEHARLGGFEAYAAFLDTGCRCGTQRPMIVHGSYGLRRQRTIAGIGASIRIGCQILNHHIGIHAVAGPAECAKGVPVCGLLEVFRWATLPRLTYLLWLQASSRQSNSPVWCFGTFVVFCIRL